MPRFQIEATTCRSRSFQSGSRHPLRPASRLRPPSQRIPFAPLALLSSLCVALLGAGHVHALGFEYTRAQELGAGGLPGVWRPARWRCIQARGSRHDARGCTVSSRRTSSLLSPLDIQHKGGYACGLMTCSHHTREFTHYLASRLFSYLHLDQVLHGVFCLLGGLFRVAVAAPGHHNDRRVLGGLLHEDQRGAGGGWVGQPPC